MSDWLLKAAIFGPLLILWWVWVGGLLYFLWQLAKGEIGQ